MARSFNGTSDFISVTTNSGISPTNNWTLSCWVKLNTLGIFQHLFVKPAAATWISPFCDWMLRIESSNKLGAYISGAGASVTGATVFTSGVWFHCAATYTGTAIVYVNGVQDGSGALGQPAATNGQNLHLGWDQTGDTAFLNGVMADAAMWTVLLTAAEIAALGKGARPGTIRSSSLQMWLPLGGIASPEADISGFINNGNLTGTSPDFGPPIMQFTPRWPRFMTPPPAVTYTLMPQIVT